MEQYDLDSGQGFEEVDADAVCEQCGTVNEEGTLLCKSCGNNLRDQRNRRIAAGAGPDLMNDGRSKFQLLTGLLVAFGILIVFYVVWNIDNFEAMMVESMTTSAGTTDVDMWTGSDAGLYQELLDEITKAPTPATARQATLRAPQIETTYNGRYILIMPGELNANRVIGEANLRRLGERIYFVFKTDNGRAEIRGYAKFESVDEAEEPHPMVRQTVSIRIGDSYFSGMGVSTPAPAGGHTVFAMRDEDDRQWEVLAYRVP